MQKKLINEKFIYLTGISYSNKVRNPLRIPNREVITNLILVHSHILIKTKYDIDFNKYIFKITLSELESYTQLTRQQCRRAIDKLKEYEIIKPIYLAKNKNENSIYEYILNN